LASGTAVYTRTLLIVEFETCRTSIARFIRAAFTAMVLQASGTLLRIGVWISAIRASLRALLVSQVEEPCVLAEVASGSVLTFGATFIAIGAGRAVEELTSCARALSILIWYQIIDTCSTFCLRRTSLAVLRANLACSIHQEFSCIAITDAFSIVDLEAVIADSALILILARLAIRSTCLA
jgi:hypothetical protein